MEMESEELEESIYYIEPEEELRMEEEFPSRLLEESVNISRQDVEMVQEAEQEVVEVQEPEYKPYHINTETLVNNEIKQLILTKVSQETNAETLNNMSFEVKEQITSLESKRNELLNKNKELEQEVELDEERLEQSETIILKTNEMIGLLKENVQKLENRLKESGIKDLLDKSQKQHSTLESLKNLCDPTKLEKQKLKMKEMLNIESEHKLVLKSQLEHRQQFLQELRKRFDKISAINLSYSVELEKRLKRKEYLQQKLTTMNSKKNINYNKVENEIFQLEEQIEKVKAKSIQTDRLISNLREQKLQLEEQMQQCVWEIDDHKANIIAIKEESSQKESRLKGLKEQYEVSKNRSEETINLLKQTYENVCSKYDDLTSNISSSSESCNKLYEDLEKLKDDYFMKCEKKLQLTERNLKAQTALRAIEKQFSQTKTDNAAKLTKLEELQIQYNNACVSLKSCDQEIINMRDKTQKDLIDAKTKYDLIKTKHEQFLVEMKQRKEYLFTTCNCLKERLATLRQEVAASEELCKSILEQSKSLKQLSEKKASSLKELKTKLQALNNKSITPIAPLKSGLKSPGKANGAKTVKFNDILSFKSATESEDASQTASQSLTHEPQLETSINEWLQDTEIPANDFLENRLNKTK